MLFLSLLLLMLAVASIPPLPSWFGWRTFQDRARIAAGLAFIVGGSLHFSNPDTYLAMMPDALPARLALVYVSGAAEIAGGVGLFIRPLQRAAAWGLVILLVAIFPANIKNALDSGVSADGLPGWYHWVRLPFQAVYIWWVLWATRPEPETSADRER